MNFAAKINENSETSNFITSFFIGVDLFAF